MKTFKNLFFGFAAFALIVVLLSAAFPGFPTAKIFPFDMDIRGSLKVELDTTDRAFFVVADSSGGTLSLMDTTGWGASGSTSYWTSDGSNGIYNNNTGNVGIGTLSPQTKLHISDSTGSLGMIAYMYSSTTGNYPQLNFGKYNGSPSSYAAIVNNTVLGGINFSASHNTSALGSGAAIRIMSVEDWSATEHGTEMLFYTCMADSNTADNTVTINENADLVLKYGDISINGGWNSWTPTFTWSGPMSAPTMSNEVYMYNVVNNVVRVLINFKVDNTTETTITDMEMTLPITPADVNGRWPLNEYTVVSGGTFGRDWGSYVDGQDNTPGNRKLKTAGTVSIPAKVFYTVFIEGFYAID